MDADDSQAEICDGIGRAAREYQTAVDGLDEAITDLLGINRTDGRLMDLIDQHAPIAAGELACRAGLSPAAITAAVDRLEAAGYAQRSRASADRRRILIAPTAMARRRFRELYGPLGAEGREMLSRFTPAELDVIGEFLRLSREMTERRAASVRGFEADGCGARAAQAVGESAGEASA